MARHEKDAIAVWIDAPHFCAGVELFDGKVVKTAPILKYMMGWDVNKVTSYCGRITRKKKKWKWEMLYDERIQY